MRFNITSDNDCKIIKQKVLRFQAFMFKRELNLYRTVLGSIVRFFISTVRGGVIGVFIFICLVFVLSLFPMGVYFIILDILRVFIVFLVIVFLGKQILKIRKCALQYPEHAKQIYRANALAFLFIFSIFYFSLVIFNILSIREGELSAYGAYGDCEETTRIFNGGRKEFQGKAYKIQFCSRSIGRFVAMPGDGASENEEIRLSVFDDKNNLLILRYFFTNFHSPHAVIYEKAHIEYVDESEDYYRTIMMPPSKLELIKTLFFPRIPLIRVPILGFYLQDFNKE